MKKLLTVIIIAVIMLLCACSSSQAPLESTVAKNSETTVAPETTTQEPTTKAETTTPPETTSEETTQDLAALIDELWASVSTYSGSGDTVLELEPRDDIWMFLITGNAEGHKHFAVTGYDDNNNYVDLFVNITDPYSGVTFDADQETSLLEIKATGDWEVQQIPIQLAAPIGKGDTYDGNGDTVLIVSTHGRTAHVTSNEPNKHFAIVTYDEYLHYDDLLVNALGPYDGQVRLDNPTVMVVNAVGEWSITLE